MADLRVKPAYFPFNQVVTQKMRSPKGERDLFIIHIDGKHQTLSSILMENTKPASFPYEEIMAAWQVPALDHYYCGIVCV